METVFRGAIVYIMLLTVTRLTGRRSLAQITPFDVVLLLIIAETVQQSMLGDDMSITNAIVLIVSLATIDVALAWAKDRWPFARNWIEGRPTILMSDGKPDLQALRRARVGLPDVMQAARQTHGLATLDEVEAAILEIDGAISIIPRQE